nr:AI-2E family transporter [Lachnospiraceae bacterium]
MKFEDLKNKKWYNGMVIACSAVILYVLLTNIVSVWNVITRILGYFAPLILGCILAYLVNPLAKWFESRIFKKVKKENLKWTASVIVAFVTVVLLLTFLLGTVIPQLVDSIKTFSGNFDGYVAAFQDLINRWQLSKYVDVKKLMSSSENMWKTIVVYISDNIDNIVETSADVGKTLVNWVLGLVL